MDRLPYCATQHRVYAAVEHVVIVMCNAPCHFAVRLITPVTQCVTIAITLFNFGTPEQDALPSFHDSDTAMRHRRAGGMGIAYFLLTGRSTGQRKSRWPIQYS